MRKFNSSVLSVLFLFLVSTIVSKNANAQVAVTVTNPLLANPDLAASYTSLNAAINALRGTTSWDAAGTVTLTCAAGTEIAPISTTPLPGAAFGGGFIINFTAVSTAANPVIIQGAGSGPPSAPSTIIVANAGLTLGSLNDAIFKIIGSDFVTIRYFNMQDNANATSGAPVAAATNTHTEFGVGLFYTSLTNGAQNNTIQDNVISLRKLYRNSYGIYSNTQHSATSMTVLAEVTAASGGNSFNKVYGNNFSDLNVPVCFVGAGSVAATVVGMDDGNDIGGSSLATGNTFSNVLNNSFRETAYVGTTVDNHYALYFQQQKNLNVSRNTGTASYAASVVNGAIVVHHGIAGGPTSGSNNNTIRFNDFNFVNTPPTGSGGSSLMIRVNAITGGPQIAMLANSSMIVTDNVVRGQNTGTVGTNQSVHGLNQALAYNFVDASRNIFESKMTSTAGINFTVLGLTMGGSPNSMLIEDNIMRNFVATGAGQSGFGLCFGMNVNTGTVNSLIIRNNKFGDASNPFITAVNPLSGVQQGTFLQMQVANAAPTCTVLIENNDLRACIFPNGALNELQGLAIFTGTQSFTVKDNTWTNLNLNNAGPVFLLNYTPTTPIGGTSTVTGNKIVGTFSRTVLGTSSTAGITAGGGSNAGATVNFTNNDISNVTLLGTGGFTGISNTDGGSVNKTITGNTVSNITTSTGSLVGMTVGFGGGAGGTGNMISGNTITNLSGAGSVTAFDLQTGGISTALHTFTANNINTLSSSGTASTVNGLTVSGAPNSNIFGNTIHTLSSSGATIPLVNGINVSAGTTATVQKNKIYGLSVSQPLSTQAAVNGILFSGGTIGNAYNNLISGLTAPLANMADAIRGIAVTSTTDGTNYNVYNNTVLLTGSGGASFGTSAMYHTDNTTSSIANLDLRNNILVNNTSPGTGIAAAFRRSSGGAATLANYACTSNNNLFYAGTPSANNLIYYDVTTSLNSLADYKAGVITAGNVAPRDQASVTENPTFISTTGSDPNFLHIAAGATQIASAGVAIPGVTDDFDGTTRPVAPGTQPDIGADEGSFTLNDATGPSIACAEIATSSCAPSLSVSIVDGSGVNTTGGSKPRIWYRKSSNTNIIPATNDNTTNGWKWVEATNASSPFTFTLDYSILSGLAPIEGENVFYFIAAQDLDVPQNFSVSAAIFSSPQTTVALTTGILVTPNTTKLFTKQSAIAASGVTVGAAGNFTSLTGVAPGGLFAAINEGGLSGNTTVTLIDPIITEPGTVALNQINYCGGTYTLTIQPTVGSSSVLTGNVAGPLIKLNGADNVTFTASPYVGFDLPLTIQNTSVSALASTIMLINDATNNTFSNASIRGSSPSLISGTFVFSTSTGGTLGNSNNLITSCDISDAGTTPANAIYSSGSDAAPNGSNTISGCRIYNFTNSGVFVNTTGAGNGWTVNPTSFYQTATRSNTNLTCLQILGGSGHSILNNSIGGTAAGRSGTPTTLVGSDAAGTTTAGNFIGILLSVGTASPTSVQGNRIGNLNINGNPIGSTQTFQGIRVTSGNVNIGTISGNVIGGGVAGGGTAADTIRTSASSQGINNVGVDAINISNNTVGNITYYNNAANTITAISSTGGINTINNNIVRDITANLTTGSIIGISMQPASSGNTLSGNQIFNLTYTNFAGGGLVIGIVTANMLSTNNIVTKNKIYDLDATSAGATFLGIQGASPGVTYSNNMVSIIPTGTSFNHLVEGMRDQATIGTNNWYFNSVHIGGNNGGGASNSYGFRQTSIANLNVKNNIFSNRRVSSTGSIAVNCAIAKTSVSPFGWTSTASNNNDLFSVNISTIGLWGGTTTQPPINFGRSLALWQSAQTNNPATSGSGGDAQSFTALPPYVNVVTGDLHIQLAVETQLESAGATGTGITVDFDNQNRCPGGGCPGGVLIPDVGADEFNGPPPTPMVYTSSAVTQNTMTDATTNTANVEVIGIQIVTTGVLSPRSVTSFTIPTTGTTNLADISNAKLWYTGQDGVFGTSTQYGSTIAAPGATLTFTATLALASGINYFWLTYDLSCTSTPDNKIDAQCTSLDVDGPRTPSPTTVDAPGTPPGNRNIATGPLSGIKTVGSGGDFLTLKAAIDRVNASGLGGNTTLSILEDLVEDGETTINQWTECGGSGFTLTIKPSVAGITISASSSSSTIKLFGADRVIIDGSVAGGANTVCPAATASRDMTIENTNQSPASAVIWITVTGANGSNNNIVRNCNIKGAGPEFTLWGISNSGAIGASPTTAKNDNNSFINNNFTRSQMGIFTSGINIAGKTASTVINQNRFNTDAPNNVRRGAIAGLFENGMTVSGNIISDIRLTTTFDDVFGIFLGAPGLAVGNGTNGGSECTNSTITFNNIGSVEHYNTGSAIGIFLAPGSSGTSLIANNTVYGVAANSTAGDFNCGIFVTPQAGSTTNIHHNSVSMNQSIIGSDEGSFALGVQGPGAPTLNIRNNLFMNTANNGGSAAVPVAKFHYAIGLAYSTFTTITCNNNLLYVPGTTSSHKLGGTGSLPTPTIQLTLTDWQANTGGLDGASQGGNPIINSNTFLAPQPTSPLLLNGAAGTGIANDINCVTRPNTPPNPTIGAYELAVDAGGPAISYTPLTNTISATNRTTVSFATITDPSGVNTTTFIPRLYYRKSTDQDTIIDNLSTSNGWKFVVANVPLTSPFNFTIDYSKLNGGSAQALDTIVYFVTAQDGLSNVGMHSGIFAAQPSNVALTTAAVPLTGNVNRYTILLSIPVISSYCQNFDAITNPIAPGWGSAGIAATGGIVNDWLIGVPNKSQITSAFSLPNAWTTNTTAGYNAFQNSYVVTPSFNFSTAITDPVISFMHNFRTQADFDGGVLEISTDGGTVWTRVDSTVGTAPAFTSLNGSTAWYNNVSASSATYLGGVKPPKWANTGAGANGSTLYTGNILGWVLSTTKLTGMAGQSNVQLRWRFTSDFGNNSNGWAIDDFCVFVSSNDNASGAVDLTVDAGCTGTPYSNAGSSQSTGTPAQTEPFAACKGTAGYKTVWFKFLAPASGNVRVSNDYTGGSMGEDSRLALFSATNVNDYTTFTSLACDNDNGTTGTGTRSILYATGLTPGNTYYVQVDGISALTQIGSFCLSVDELTSAMISSEVGCVFGQPLTVVNNDYTGMMSVTAADGRLTALINNAPGGVGTSTYTDNLHVNTAAVRKEAVTGQNYLDRNYTISNPGVTSVNLKLFLLNAELTALQAAEPGLTLASLQVTRQTGSLCDNDFIAASGTNSSISQTANYSGTGYSWVQITSPGLSKFYLHRPAVRMPVKVWLQGAYTTLAAQGGPRHRNNSAAWAGALNAGTASSGTPPSGNALSQPYNLAPFNYTGTESVPALYFKASTTGGGVLDWVLLELRNGATPATVVARRAAFVRLDGRVVDLDSTSDVLFRGVPAGTYHLVVRHRNHLPIRTSANTAMSVTLGAAAPALLNADFSTAQAKAFDSTANLVNRAMKEITPGVFGMWGGNSNGMTTGLNALNQVKASAPNPSNDYFFLFNTTLTGSLTNVLTNRYHPADVNMDAQVKMTAPNNTNDFFFLFNTVLSGNIGIILNQHQ